MKQGKTFGLIGEKLGHSLSGQIHSRLFAALGAEARYDLIEIPREAFADTFPRLLAEYDGLNVTIPYKRAVLPYLEALSPEAADYGAVNTVDCAARTGHNTDVTGFLRSLGARVEALSGDVLLLGAGGAARMMAKEALRRCRSLTVAVRDPGSENAVSLRQELAGAAVRFVPLGQIEGPYDALLNATPVGMWPQVEGCPVDESVIARCGFVFDAIYNPAETRLLQAARALGVPALGGMGMLVLQAAAAQEIWLGRPVDGNLTDELIQSLEGTNHAG